MRGLNDLEEQKVDFEETWAILHETFVNRDEVGVVAVGGEGFASDYTTVVDRTQKLGYCLHGDGDENHRNHLSHDTNSLSAR